MKKVIYALVLLVTLSSCQKKERAQTFIGEELKTMEDRKAFLQKVFESDQEVREGLSETELSEKEYYDRMNKADDVNLSKIKWYLDNYDYPSKKVFNESQSMIPALVVHHSFEPNIRRKMYPKFKKAYDVNNLDSDFFALYLGRLFEIENDTYFRMQSPYSIEDQITTLIDTLKLEN
ncbi:membrane lipoprotein lipid attachment site-containing protein [Nonlabens sp.]|uniref:membrane lipoprotein lipid attachment site-containing protein n=1 Tax=Nonlabens sp. TaxID=1888209 RepID=UPI003264100E